MRAVLAVLLLLPLAACEIVYKLPTRQGNVLEQKELDKLTVGMTREQVRFVLGTPVATSGFRDDRWEYFGYYKPPRGKPYSRIVTLFFNGDTLARMEGEKKPPRDAGDKPDLEQIEKDEQKAATEKERAKEEKEQNKGVIAPPKEESPGNAP